MTLLLLVHAAFADPLEPYELMRARTWRSLGADTILGQPPTAMQDAALLDRLPATDPLVAQLRAAREHELRGLDSELGEPVWVVRPAAELSVGTFTPILDDGDVDPGLFSATLAVDAATYAGPLEARILARGDLDLLPTKLGGDLEQWRIGVRTRGFGAAVAQEARWYGPGRHSSLIFTDNARPLPALSIHGDSRLPGKASVIGRFAGDLLVGLVPGERRDVTLPAWLLVDLRWSPVPAFEVGLVRNAMFGGWQDGELRPIDFDQLILPTEPHIYDDPERQLFDTDERLAYDLRLTLPVRKWTGLPIDYVEGFIQHGGEDAGGSGFLNLPFLAGAANIYGGELSSGPLVVGVERAIVEDDYQRWYVGHRLYHDGWTRDGRVIGNPWGGDSTSWSAHAGLVGIGAWTLVGTYVYAHRWLVADLQQDTLFVFPDPEIRHLIGAKAALAAGRGGRWQADAEVSPVTSRGFVPDDDGIEFRVALSWSVDPLPRTRP